MTGSNGNKNWMLPGPLVSVSAAQKLLQLFILHRVYRTPVQLHHWGSRDTPICPKCQVHPGDLLHMLWKCPKLVRYWNKVVAIINSIFQVQLPMDPLVCLLEAWDEDLYSPHTYIALIRLLYLARKLVARYWLSARILTSKQWIQAVNDILIREKNTYSHRKSPQTFEKIWPCWLGAPEVPPPQLVLHRLLQCW